MVADEEIVCRGIYTNHLRGKTLKKSWLKKSDLAEGTVSVWRMSVVGSLDAMNELLKSRAQTGDELLRIVGLPVNQVRGANVSGRARSFCVVDDTEERPGVNHPAHASIACCESIPRADLGSAAFMEVYDAVFNLYSEAELWAKAA